MTKSRHRLHSLQTQRVGAMIVVMVMLWYYWSLHLPIHFAHFNLCPSCIPPCGIHSRVFFSNYSLRWEGLRWQHILRMYGHISSPMTFWPGRLWCEAGMSPEGNATRRRWCVLWSHSWAWHFSGIYLRLRPDCISSVADQRTLEIVNLHS